MTLYPGNFNFDSAYLWLIFLTSWREFQSKIAAAGKESERQVAWERQSEFNYKQFGRREQIKPDDKREREMNGARWLPVGQPCYHLSTRPCSQQDGSSITVNNPCATATEGRRGWEKPQNVTIFYSARSHNLKFSMQTAKTARKHLDHWWDG